MVPYLWRLRRIVNESLRILTVDLEDWFHLLDHAPTRFPAQWTSFESRVEQNVHRMLELLEQNDRRATWFCLAWVAERFPALIRRVAEKHEIACHTYAHQLAYQQTPEEFRADAIRAKMILEDITGKEVAAFRAAGFSVTPGTPWFFEEVAACGFTIDSSVFPARRGHGGYPGFGASTPCRIRTTYGELKEFPMSVARLAGLDFAYSGGGYFRLSPYFLTSHLLRNSGYTLTYFHPRDIDAGQQVLSGLPMWRRFKSYYGLQSAERKLNRLLQEFQFDTLGSAVDAIDWEQTPLIEC